MRRILVLRRLLAGLLVIGLWAVPSTALAHHDGNDGAPAVPNDCSVFSYVTKHLTAQNNVWVAAENFNHKCIDGQGGNDDLTAVGGTNDALFGGAGADFIDGGGWQDGIHGGTGNDTLRGAGGGDRMYGAADADTLRGEDGADNLFGDDFSWESDHYGFDSWNDYQDPSPSGVGGADEMFGADGDDWIWESNSDNYYDGAVDRIHGGPGYDICIVGPEDIYDGCEEVHVLTQAGPGAEPS